MRRTNEEFAAEVFRRSAEYRQARTRKLRAAGSTACVLCLALLGGAVLYRSPAIHRAENSGAEASFYVDEVSGVDGCAVEAVEGNEESACVEEDVPAAGTRLSGSFSGTVQSVPETDGESFLAAGENNCLAIQEVHAGNGLITLRLQNTSDTAVMFRPADLTVIWLRDIELTEYPYTGETFSKPVQPQETIEITVRYADFDGLEETLRAGHRYCIKIGTSTKNFQEET